MGLNEFAGYFALAITAFVSGYIAQRYGMRPAPFYLGIVYCVIGLTLAMLLVRDTRAHVQLEAANHAKDDFLAMLSHELRTPLTPVLASAGVLADDPRVGGNPGTACDVERKA